MRINIDTRSVQLTPNRLRQRKKGAGAAFPTPVPVTRSAGALIFFVVRVLGYMNRDVNAVRRALAEPADGRGGADAL